MEIMRLLTPKEVAEIIAQRTGKPISVRQVQREIRNGYIIAEMIGGNYLVKESALNHYERRHPGAPEKKKR